MVNEARRVTLNSDGGLCLNPGDVGCDAAGRWWAHPPVGDAVVLERVTMHRDGTVSTDHRFALPDPEPKKVWALTRSRWVREPE